VGLWPELALDGWRGTPAAVHNRLMAMLGWTEPYYHDIASLLLRLALTAATTEGPVRSSTQLLRLLDPEVLARLWEHDPERARRRYEGLRAKAASTSYPHEADACRAKADTLRDKYGL